MRAAGKIVAESLELVRRKVGPEVRTAELDRIVENLILSRGGRPAFKGYRGYPASICASVNEEVVHGIPGERRLNNGDIISIDVGVELNGYFADAAATFPIGDVSAPTMRLIEATKKALAAGIAMARAGKRLTDISNEIQKSAESAGFSVVRDYVGHGIGQAMHEEPQIPNYGPAGMGPLINEGMVLALEPMVNEGTFEVETLGDHWTVVTRDRLLSAHFEHTVAITAADAEILTLPDE